MGSTLKPFLEYNLLVLLGLLDRLGLVELDLNLHLQVDQIINLQQVLNFYHKQNMLEQHPSWRTQGPLTRLLK